MQRVRLASLAVVAVLALGFLGYSAWMKRHTNGAASGDGFSAGQQAATSPLDDFGSVGEFSLTERSGRKVRDADLQGKVWIASFVFTRCAGPCPRVTAFMAKLQAEFASQKDVRLVTITVDPEYDTPKVLSRYAENFSADPDRWLFLTGDHKEVYKLISQGFHLGVHQTEGAARTPGNEVTHSTKLGLVDRKGRIRQYFDGIPVDASADATPKIKEAVNAVLREQP